MNGVSTCQVLYARFLCRCVRLSRIQHKPCSELALKAATKPLKHSKYEIFARQRALNQSPLIAGQIAGLNYDRRNLFRIEKKSAVAARIAWLSRQDEEALREKRNRLEELLWVGLYADRADFYETVETPITDRNGHAVLKRNGEPYTKMVIQLKPLDKLTPQLRCLIESITYYRKREAEPQTHQQGVLSPGTAQDAGRGRAAC